MTLKARSAKRVLGGWLVAAALLLPRTAAAWTFPEHQQISGTALERLASDDATKVRWEQFRSSIDHALPLCASKDQTKCVPLAALPALAGDHACVPHLLDWELRTNTKWIFNVLEVGEETQQSLKDAGTDVADREAARRAMHINLQNADSDYVSRAMVDYSHFQLSRESAATDADGLVAYLNVVLAPNAQANATASYVNYHVAALRLAAAARFDPANKVAYLTRALFAEAFAAHFLEDSFSTGHFVGHWGNTATRLGTHDYYSNVGFQASRWSTPGTTYVAHGDAFLSDTERDTVATAVQASLWQVVKAGTDDADAREVVHELGKGFALETYDSCREIEVAPGLRDFASVDRIQSVLREEPVPATRHPEVPRMRAEHGVFVGAAATVGTGWVRTEGAMNTRVMASLRVGYGAAGLVNDALNAQLFVESGFIGQRLYGDGGTSLTGFYFRARGPGYVFIGDGLIGIPLALGFQGDCPFCVRWAAAAGGGGLGRFWKGRHIVGKLSWQFSALRDATITFQPHDEHMRIDLFTPVFTFRHYWPMGAGSSWSQSTDLYLDLGPSTTWVNGRTAWFGASVSLSIAPRVFP